MEKKKFSFSFMMKKDHFKQKLLLWSQVPFNQLYIRRKRNNVFGQLSDFNFIIRLIMEL